MERVGQRAVVNRWAVVGWMVLAVGVTDAFGELSVRVTGGVARGREARLHDRDCRSTQPPALFGCGPGRDSLPLGAAARLGRPGLAEVAVGVKPTRDIRLEVAVAEWPAVSLSGDANFVNVIGPQPVQADLTARSAMAWVWWEPAGLRVGPVQPLFGVAAGVARHRLGTMTYRFPGLGAVASTVTPGGRTNEPAWAAAAGAGIPLGGRVRFEAAWRFSDLGSARSADGPATITRTSFTRTLVVGGTRVAVRLHAVTAGLRFRL